MTYGTIVVCGGGCYGGYYVRQLARARAAGAASFERILVVDRDPACRVARLVEFIHRGDEAGIAACGWSLATANGDRGADAPDPAYATLPIRFAAAEWQPFFADWFAAAIASPALAAHDAVVPSPLMPHLLADWVASRVALHRPGAVIERVALSVRPETPWQRTAADNAHYASFATWMCPINCIEPPRCPETRGTRDWTMPASVRLTAARAAEQGTPYDVIALFHTTHRAYGVGMFNVTDALETETAIQNTADTSSPARALVASVSHCHGALAELLWRDP